MNVFGQLVKARLENIAAAVATVKKGFIYFQTDIDKPVIDDGINVSEIAMRKHLPTIMDEDLLRGVTKVDTLANLEALTRSSGKQYYATDKQMHLYDNGNELVEFGGAGGQGGINYIDNFDFKTDVAGWTGSTNFTITHSTTSPLRGLGSAVLSKGAVNAIGETVKTNFTIDSADLAKKVTISVDYDATDANYADGDIRFKILQAPGTVSEKVIRINGEDLKASKGTHFAQFQTDASELNYALVPEVNSTKTTAYSVKIDNVKVGPQAIAYGSFVGDWKPYTPTLTNFTASSIAFEYRRVGDSIEVRGTATLNAAPTGNLQIGLPSGLTVLKTTTNRSNVVQGYDLSAANFFSGFGHVTDGDSYFEVVDDAITNLWNATTPITWASGDTIEVPPISFKIQGWSSNSQMSEDLGGREIVTHLTGVSGSHTTSGAYEKVVFLNKELDTASSYDSVNNRINILESGFYDIASVVGFISSDIGGRQIALYKNGTRFLLGAAVPGESDASALTPGDWKAIKLEKGDYLEIYMYQNSGGSLGYVTVSDGAYFTVAKRASPQTQFETETIAARYTSDSGQTVSTGANVIYEDLDFDTHNAYNNTNGEFTVPVTGKYTVSASAKPSTSTTLAISVAVNGTPIAQAFNGNASTGTINLPQEIEVKKGDIVSIINDTGGTRTLFTQSRGNTFSIARIK